ncbi:hypothetical protein [Microbacterium suaedae]|uniref:hypothetical protein n=1 Tax=Microbacterium suaedae TaxID=2067813 RepID=UPI000DA1C261|nr:hypothetical protein [Microbacterium suaedae]
MSDAQGPKNDGDAAEEQPDATAPAAEDSPAAEQAPESEGSAVPGDPNTGGSDARAFAADEPSVDDGTSAASASESGATPTAGGDPATAGDTTSEGAAPAAGDPATTGGTPSDGAAPASSDDAAEEPDYEALAAELDRLESETASAAPVAPGAREPEETEKKPGDPWFEPAANDTFTATDPQTSATTPVDEPEPVAVTSSEPAHHAAPAPGPIFVQAPEPPRKRGNRGASGLIGLLAAVVFAVLYAAASYGWQMYLSVVASRDSFAVEPLAFATDVLAQPPFWFTVIAFWLAFWLLGVFVNRARWWSWVVLGLFVALLTYAGYIGGVFLGAPFWNLTADEGMALLADTMFAVPALVAVIIAREVTIWFGAWVSRRGARITKQNAAEREEYDRLMAEGPQGSAAS